MTTMTTERVRVQGRMYEPCAESDVPTGLRWETPQRHAGQAIEVQYGCSMRQLGGADVGEKWRRVIDHSIGPRAITYYRLVSE